MNNPIQYQDDKLERFIPIGLDRLIADLEQSQQLANDQQALFQQFAECYNTLFHAQTYQHLQPLKKSYRPFNPDSDSVHRKPLSPSTITKFKTGLYQLIDDANYEKLSEKDLNEALNKISPHGVKVSVDFDDFQDVAIFYRGSAYQQQEIRDWKTLKLKKKTLQIRIFRRLFVVLHIKTRQQRIQELIDNHHVSPKKAAKKIDAAYKALGIEDSRERIYLKLFKDIPKDDLEMLFPNTKVKIKLFDKIKLGIMGGGGTAGGVAATLSKLSAAIDPISAIIAIGGLLGVLWRQIAKVFNQRAKYSAILTKNLYFYCLDNNLGALTHLIDSAESEECKEALLAYYFLLSGGAKEKDALDREIEDYIQQTYAIPMDFEIDDGLRKLNQAGLIQQDGGKISAIPLQTAIQKLNHQWRQQFHPDIATAEEN